MKKRGTPAFFLVFWAHSEAVPRFLKNDAAGHRAFFCRFCSTSKAVPLCIKNEAHRALVKHGNARAGERHQLVGHQMSEQVRHRAVQALEPGKVARAGADTTQRHLGHALGGKAGVEKAQVAHAADVDVAHRVVVGPREDGEEVEVLRGSRGWGPRPAPGWPASGSWSPRRCPKRSQIAAMSFVKARATVTLCSATPFGTLDCCVCGVAEHQGPS